MKHGPLPDGYKIAELGSMLPRNRTTMFWDSGHWTGAFTNDENRLPDVPHIYKTFTIIVPVGLVSVPLHEDFGG